MNNETTMQKLAVPLAILVAGAMIAGALYFALRGTPVAAPTLFTHVLEYVRGPQANDHIRGNPQADIVVVEYSDTECPFCKQFHTTMRDIMDEYGDSGEVAWIYRHFPIPQLHPKAPKEAEALECAAEQGGNDMFWAFADMVYDRTASNNALDIGVYNTPSTVPVNPQTGEPYYTQTEPTSETDAGQLSDFARELGLDVPTFEACIQSGRTADRINTDYNEAQEAGGGGTPHSILLFNDEQYALPGALPQPTMKQLIDMMLASDDLSRKEMEEMIYSFLQGA